MVNCIRHWNRIKCCTRESMNLSSNKWFYLFFLFTSWIFNDGDSMHPATYNFMKWCKIALIGHRKRPNTKRIGESRKWSLSGDNNLRILKMKSFLISKTCNSMILNLQQFHNEKTTQNHKNWLQFHSNDFLFIFTTNFIKSMISFDLLRNSFPDSRNGQWRVEIVPLT